MNIGGKRIPWWWLAVAVVAAGVLIAVAVGLDAGSDGASLTGLDPTPGVEGTGSAATQVDGEPDPKSETTPTASTGSAPGTSGATDEPGAKTDDPAKVATEGTVIVKYWDKTQSNRADEIDIRLAGESWSPITGGTSDTKVFGPIPLGKRIEMKVYPDGSSGSVLVVPLVVKPEMSGSTANIVHIEMRDGRVRSLGNPVVNFEVAAPRG